MQDNLQIITKKYMGLINMRQFYILNNNKIDTLPLMLLLILMLLLLQPLKSF